MSHLRIGDSVRWKWVAGYASGEVVDVTPDTVTITSKESQITRHGSAENPAVIIEDYNGARILKLESEIEQLPTLTSASRR